MTLNERNPNINSVPIGTQAATITLPVMYVRKHSRIKLAHLIDQAGISASNSNYLQFSLQDLSSNVYATYDTRAANEGALVANTPGAMTLSSPDVVLEDPSAPLSQQEVDIPAGTSLVLVITAAGTVTSTKALIQIEYYPL
jgi:hypothetical protein